MRDYGYYQNSYKRAICAELNAMLEDVRQGLNRDNPFSTIVEIIARLENRVKSVWYYATQLGNRDENVIAKLTAQRLLDSMRPVFYCWYNDKVKAHVKQYANDRIAAAIDYIADNGGWCSPEKPFEVKNAYSDDINVYFGDGQKDNRAN